MRETVCIVLNEREPTKEKVAQTLETKLNARGITTSRISIDQDLAQKVITRAPQIVVIDYLLGDYSTGLDILTSFSELETSQRPATIFLTDEPSVQVAVEAVRKGAVNYFEIDHPQSVERTINQVEKIVLEGRATLCSSKPRPELELDQLVTQSVAAQQMLLSLKVLIKKQPAITIIHGDKAGCGVSSIARLLQKHSNPEAHKIKIDLQSSVKVLAEPLGLDLRKTSTLKLGRDLSVLIDNLEQDDGELFNLIQNNREIIWGKNSQYGSQASLILASHCQSTCLIWKKAFDCDLLKVPSLSERQEDLALLAQSFAAEAYSLPSKSSLSKKNIKFDHVTANWLATLDWSGEIKELRAVVIDAIIRQNFSEAKIQDLILESKELWENSQAELEANSISIDPLIAAISFEENNFSYRRAAASLGINQTILRQSLNNFNHNKSEADSKCN